MPNVNKLGLDFEEMEFTPSESLAKKIGAIAMGDQKRIDSFLNKHNI